MPVGFITGQLQSEQRNATTGRLVIELGRNPAPGELERRLRTVLRDPTLAVLHWSDAAGAYVDVTGKPAPLPAEGDRRGVTYLERQGRPMTALVHDPKVLDDAGLSETVLAAVRFVVEKERLHGQIQATSIDAAALPSGFVTLLMTDIEASTALLRRLGDGYGALLNDVRSIVRRAVSQGSGHEIDARADEFFAVFDRPAAAVEAAVAVQRALGTRTWPNALEVRVRVGIHSGRPTLTDVGYIGLAVHTTARLCTAAHGGQIVVSAATRTAAGRAGTDRRPIPEPRSTPPARPSRRRDPLPDPGTGTTTALPTPAHQPSLGAPPPPPGSSGRPRGSNGSRSAGASRAQVSASACQPSFQPHAPTHDGVAQAAVVSTPSLLAFQVL